MTDFLAVLGLLGWMVWLDWQLSLLMLLAVPVFLVTVRYFSRRLRRLSRVAQQLMGDVNHRLRETLDAEKAVRVFGGRELRTPAFRPRRRRSALQLIQILGWRAPIRVPSCKSLLRC